MNYTFIKNLIILTGFQITWLSCFFGEYYHLHLVGVFVGIAYLIIFFIFIKNKMQSFKICSFISIIGYFFDTTLAYFDLYIFKSSILFGFLPLWFLILWPCFATLFVSTFYFLKNKIFLSFFLGATLGPLTYYSGIYVEIVYSTNIYLTFSLMIIFWGTFLSSYSRIIDKFIKE